MHDTSKFKNSKCDIKSRYLNHKNTTIYQVYKYNTLDRSSVSTQKVHQFLIIVMDITEASRIENHIKYSFAVNSY